MRLGKRLVNMLILIIGVDIMIVVRDDIEKITICVGMNLSQ
jgi:hypothetical protein